MTPMVASGARIARAAVSAVSLVLVSAATLPAQERLLTSGSITGSAIFESEQFGSAGLAIGSAIGGATQRVKSASEFTIPLGIAIPLGDRWRIDAGASYSSGSVSFLGAGSSTQSVSLSGLTDIRVRATGHIVGDNLLFTVGFNAPTGVHTLDTARIDALGVLAAPALGIHLPPVSLGPGATTGLVYALSSGDWAWAAGASFEVRGAFSPVAALTAGFPNPKFDPGNSVHVSLSTDGPVGAGALNLLVTADVYTDDRLSSGDVNTTASLVRLGPIVSAEVRYAIPSSLFRNLVLFAGDQFRAAFQRDGQTVSGTSGNYLRAGLHGEVALSPSTSITGAIDGWQHSRLSVNQSLVTSGTTTGSLTLGLMRAMGNFALNPFVAVRAGSIDSGLERGSVTGLSAGVTFSQRF